MLIMWSSQSLVLVCLVASLTRAAGCPCPKDSPSNSVCSAAYGPSCVRVCSRLTVSNMTASTKSADINGDYLLLPGDLSNDRVVYQHVSTKQTLYSLAGPDRWVLGELYPSIFVRATIQDAAVHPENIRAGEWTVSKSKNMLFITCAACPSLTLSGVVGVNDFVNADYLPVSDQTAVWMRTGKVPQETVYLYALVSSPPGGWDWLIGSQVGGTLYVAKSWAATVSASPALTTRTWDVVAFNAQLKLVATPASAVDLFCNYCQPDTCPESMVCVPQRNGTTTCQCPAADDLFVNSTCTPSETTCDRIVVHGQDVPNAYASAYDLVTCARDADTSKPCYRRAGGPGYLYFSQQMQRWVLSQELGLLQGDVLRVTDTAIKPWLIDVPWQHRQQNDGTWGYVTVQDVNISCCPAVLILDDPLYDLCAFTVPYCSVLMATLDVTEGSDVFKHITGRYYELEYFINHRPAFAIDPSISGSSTPQYIYYSVKLNSWILGTSTDDTKVLLRQRQNIPTPENATELWDFYGTPMLGFDVFCDACSNPDICPLALTCTAKKRGADCGCALGYIVVNGSTCAPKDFTQACSILLIRADLYGGRYHRQDATPFGDRPAYQHESSNLTFYYLPTSEQWAIGTSIGASYTLAQIEASVYFPEQLANTHLSWMLAGKIHSVEIQCLCESPDNVTLVLNSTTALVEWDKLRPLLHNISQIEVLWRMESNHHNVTTSISSLAPGSAWIAPLRPFTKYAILVRAITPFCQAYDSNAWRVQQTAQDLPGAAPRLISVVTTDTSLRLAWTPLPTELRNGIITSYQLRYAPWPNQTRLAPGTAFEFSPPIVVEELEGLLQQLQPAIGYDVEVRAQNVIGIGPALTVSRMSAEAAPSSAPQNITAQAVGDSVQVTWLPPPAHLQNGQLVSFTLHLYLVAVISGLSRRDLATSNTVNEMLRATTPLSPLSVSAHLRQHRLTGLMAGHTYIVALAASTRSGEGPHSDNITVMLTATPTATGSSADNNHLMTSITVGAGVVVSVGLFFLAVMWASYHRRRRKLHGISDQHTRIPDSLLARLSNLEIPPESVELGSKLGEGQFGEVWSGAVALDSGLTLVAIKMLKSCISSQDRLFFMEEALRMRPLQHDNVTRLLAVCFRHEPNFIVLEYMAKGDLKQYLQRSRATSGRPCLLSVGAQLYIALQVARGMEYLAEHKYVHRDIAARNILINAKNICKIGDFGMARNVYQSDYYRISSAGPMPLRWLAPESVIDGIHSEFSEIWMFGVLLWEILSFGEMPWPGTSDDIVLRCLRAGICMEPPQNADAAISAIMIQCWHQVPQQRIAMRLVVVQLDSLLTSMLQSGESILIPELSDLTNPTPAKGFVGPQLVGQASSGQDRSAGAFGLMANPSFDGDGAIQHSIASPVLNAANPYPFSSLGDIGLDDFAHGAVDGHSTTSAFPPDELASAAITRVRMRPLSVRHTFDGSDALEMTELNTGALSCPPLTLNTYADISVPGTTTAISIAKNPALEPSSGYSILSVGYVPYTTAVAVAHLQHTEPLNADTHA